MLEQNGWEKLKGHLTGKGSLRSRLLRIGLFFLAVALIMNTLAGFIYTYARNRRSAGQIQAEVALRVAGKIERFVQREQERLVDFARFVSLQQLETEQQRSLARLLLTDDPSYTEIAILNSGGMEVVKVSGRKAYLPGDLSDQSQSEKFASAMKGQNYVSGVYTSETAEPYVTVSAPIRMGPELIAGVAVGELNLKFLWRVIDDVKFGSAGYAYLVDQRGSLLASPDLSEVLAGRPVGDLPVVRRFLENHSFLDPKPAKVGEGLYGEPVISSYARIPKIGWGVVLEEPVRAALAEQRKLVAFALLLLAVGLALGAVVIVWVSNRITRPVRELHHGAETIAGGHLDHRVEIRTGDEIEELAHAFNGMAAKLKESYSTLEQRVTQRTHELSVLYSITAGVSRSLDLDVILGEAIENVLAAIGFDAGMIFLFDPKDQLLHLRMIKGLSTGPRSLPHRVGEGVVGKVAETGAELIFEDMQTDPRFITLARGRQAFDFDFHANATFPIRVKERIPGVFTLLSRNKHRFSSEDLQLINSMAGQIGVAIENAALFEQARKKSDELEALVKVSRDIAALLDREALLAHIADLAQRVLNVDGVSFRLVDGNRTVRVAVAGMPIGGFLPTARRGGSLTDRVLHADAPVTVRRLEADSGVPTEARDALRQAGFTSFLGVPLKVGEQLLGSINLYTREEREFQSGEITTVTTFAEQAAIAIHNANLFAELRSKSLELERLNQNLLEANRAKSDFIGAMSHELKTPLSVIMGECRADQRGFFGAGQRETRRGREEDPAPFGRAPQAHRRSFEAQPNGRSESDP